MKITIIKSPNSYIVETREGDRILDMQSVETLNGAQAARNLVFWTLDALGYSGKTGKIEFAEEVRI